MAAWSVAKLSVPFLEGNAQWSASMNTSHPGFLYNLSLAQAPPIVWIGCSDSRIPESVITDQLPGQIFTHRNIANQFQVKDNNAGAVVEYAVDHLNVSNIVIVGHTGCGGIKAVYDAVNFTSYISDHPDHTGCAHIVSTKPTDDPLNNFLIPITKLRQCLPANATNMDLTVANVQMQVQNVYKSSIFKKAWETTPGREMCVHGWLYDLSTGLLSSLGMTTCGNGKVTTDGNGKPKKV
ncbi:uncharacterized protein EHS24_003100 [Apiotrichum porosum]|uniref:Carbonic anhydrase n=1 Tax=Apiotrichum porosum TaxID=105984 RepID=A0A427XFP9_9TREE|nr:uncharacterized protein EHS24_003100 [Apiotrichum porosum]RSH77544.1 hypothetical protein EHS24_003100 [Apiotrichum porosum]